MPRLANIEWSLPEGKPVAGGALEHSWEAIQTAILMDIRQEIQKLNRILGCANFLEVPHVLRAIRRNTAKPQAKKVKS